jgi:hypothetical protein
MAKEMGESKTPSMGTIERMEIKPAENGGHVVTHHMKPKMGRDSKAHSGMAMGYSEPETHVFGKDEGHEMLAHVANHLSIPELHESESDEKDNDDGVGKDGEFD